MERVVVLDMLHYCKQQGLISKQQHGFLAGVGVGSVVERRSLAGGLSLSCARPAANG